MLYHDLQWFDCIISQVGNGFDDDTLERLQGELLPGWKKIRQDRDKVKMTFKK